LTRLDDPEEKLRESADRRFSASSNDERVRVEGSTKCAREGSAPS